MRTECGKVVLAYSRDFLIWQNNSIQYVRCSPRSFLASLHSSHSNSLLIRYVVCRTSTAIGAQKDGTHEGEPRQIVKITYTVGPLQEGQSWRASERRPVPAHLPCRPRPSFLFGTLQSPLSRPANYSALLHTPLTTAPLISQRPMPTTANSTGWYGLYNEMCYGTPAGIVGSSVLSFGGAWLSNRYEADSWHSCRVACHSYSYICFIDT